MRSFISTAEELVFIPFGIIFKVVSRFISYTFAVAFTTSLAGFMIAVYIALFLSGTLDFAASGTGDAFIRLFFLLTALEYAPGYYLHFGMLHRLGVPCFTKNLNLINRFIKKNVFVPPMDDPESVVRLMRALENLPRSNMLAAMIYPSIVMVSVVVQEFLIGTMFNAGIMFLGISSAIFIYVFTTYIAAELLTGAMRKKVKRYIFENNIPYEESSHSSIRRKFIFITLLVLIAMAELSLMVFYTATRSFSILPIIFIIFTGMLVGALLFFYMQSIMQSLIDIEGAALDLAAGGMGRLYLVGLDREIVATGKSFTSAAMEVTEIRENLERKVVERTRELNEALKKLEEKDKQIQQQLAVASRIQKGILPNASMVQNGLNMVAYHQSMEEIGGDFYDIIPLRNNCIGFLMADVSGHGIPAALVTTMAKIIFVQGSQNCLSPKRIFKRVNESIVNIIKTEEYLTAFLVIISPSFDILYSNASHRPAFVYRKKTGEVETWDTNGLFIGAIDNSEVGESYEEKADKIEPGDRIFLYTDGLIEARSMAGEEFGEERVKSILTATKDQPADDMRRALLDSWKEFIGNSSINDDVTFLIIEFAEVSEEAISLRTKAENMINEQRYEAAIPMLVQALDKNDQDIWAHELLGLCYFKTGDFFKSIEHLNAYTIKNPGDQYPIYLLSAALYNSQDYSRALLNARSAIKLNPNDAKTLVVMAKSLQKLGRQDEAVDVWKQVLEIDPANPVAKREIFQGK